MSLFRLRELIVKDMPIRVAYLDEDGMRLQVNKFFGLNETAYGLSLLHMKQIYINKNMEEEFIKSTLFHEAMHLLLQQDESTLKVVEFPKVNIEEVLVRLITKHWFEIYNIYKQIYEPEEKEIL